MKNKYYKALGFYKILEKLKAEVECEDSKLLIERLEPNLNFDQVRAELLKTEEAFNLGLRFSLPSFNGLTNIDLSLKRAVGGGILSNLEFLRIRNVLRVFEELKNFSNKAKAELLNLNFEFSDIYTNKYLIGKIDSIIISEDEISDTASSELFTIRSKIKSTSNKIREHLEKIIRSSSTQKYLQEAIITVRNNRFVVPVRSECRKEIAGLVIDSSASGSTVFIEPMAVVESNNSLKILYAKEEAEIEKILKELSSETAGFAENILKSYKIAIKLSVIFAKANLAYKMRATLPKINENGIINLKNSRHPLIDSKKVVPTNINLGKSFNTLVITGPNTGGKTVALKTVGLFCLMAMCGLFIPADENSSVSVFENILCDIGDEQSVEQSLSTFSSHMKNIIEIFKISNSKSLVLLDELGAGTDPIEGAALATAILESLKEKNAKIIATTHYAELKAYALSAAQVSNASCEFDEKTLQPTYKLLIGLPGKSNAFLISQKLGLSEKIIERAKNNIAGNESVFQDVISSLEKQHKQLEAESENLRVLIQENNFLKQQLQLKEKTFLEQRNLEKEKAGKQAQEIIYKAKMMAESVFEDLEKLKNQTQYNKQDINKLRKEISKAERGAHSLKQNKNEGYILPRKLKKGDSVLIFDIDKKATVLEIEEKAQKVLVQAGIIKTWVKLKNLRLIDEPKILKPKSTGFRTIKCKSSAPVVRQLDLRGFSALEAIMELEQFIDSALLMGVNEILVIHGKGTGILRKEIHKYLKSNKSVKSFRLGTFGEGENGVTIMSL